MALHSSSSNVVMLATLLAMGLASGETRVARGEEISGTVDLPSLTSAVQQRAPVRYAGQTGAKVAKPRPPRAVVYLAGSFSEEQLAAARKTRGQAVVGQENFRFTPNILAVIRGTTVAFPNLDDDYHNVFSYSKSKRFDLGRYLKSESAPTVTFDTAGEVRLFCEIHRHMRGTVLVLETPYFVTTEENGSYRLKNLPAGNYELVVWISEKKQLRRQVAVPAKGSQRIDFSGS